MIYRASQLLTLLFHYCLSVDQLINNIKNYLCCVSIGVDNFLYKLRPHLSLAIILAFDPNILTSINPACKECLVKSWHEK